MIALHTRVGGQSIWEWSKHQSVFRNVCSNNQIREKEVGGGVEEKMKWTGQHQPHRIKNVFLHFDDTAEDNCHKDKSSKEEEEEDR